jgi:hypothetical protein
MSQKTTLHRNPFLIGAVGGIIFPLYVWEVIQGIAAFFAGAQNVNFGISGIKLCTYFDWVKGEAVGVIIYLIPYLLSMAAVTTIFKFQKKAFAGPYRHFLISFFIVLSGLLILNIFYGAFSIILKFNPDNDWVKIITLMGLTETTSMLFIFMIIIFTAGYLNLILKRILHLINI